jgi:hypothetical protein
MSSAHPPPTTHLKPHTTRLRRRLLQLCLPCKPSLSRRLHACPRLRERKSNVHRLLSLHQCMSLQRARWRSTTTTMTAEMTTSALRNKRVVAAVPRLSTADRAHLRAAQSSSRLRKLAVADDLYSLFCNPGDDYDVHECLRGKGVVSQKNHSNLR